MIVIFEPTSLVFSISLKKSTIGKFLPLGTEPCLYSIFFFWKKTFVVDDGWAPHSRPTAANNN